MRITVIAPERAVYDGVVDSVVAPAYDGEVGILPKHAPFMTLLGDGRLVVREGSVDRAFRVRGGFLQVVRDQVKVVTEDAHPEEKS